MNEKNASQRPNRLIEMDNLNSLDFLQWISFTNLKKNSDRTEIRDIFKQVLTIHCLRLAKYMFLNEKSLQ